MSSSYKEKELYNVYTVFSMATSLVTRLLKERNE